MNVRRSPKESIQNAVFKLDRNFLDERQMPRRMKETAAFYRKQDVLTSPYRYQPSMPASFGSVFLSSFTIVLSALTSPTERAAASILARRCAVPRATAG